jgi:hypothetical protein
VSLVKESSLTKGSIIEHGISHIQGITGDFMEIKDETKLS